MLTIRLDAASSHAAANMQPRLHACFMLTTMYVLKAMWTDLGRGQDLELALHKEALQGK